MTTEDIADKSIDIAVIALVEWGTVLLPWAIIKGYSQGVLPWGVAAVLGLGVLAIFGSFNVMAVCMIKDSIFKKPEAAIPTLKET